MRSFCATLYNIIILIYCYVLTEYNTIYKSKNAIQFSAQIYAKELDCSDCPCTLCASERHNNKSNSEKATGNLRYNFMSK